VTHEAATGRACKATARAHARGTNHRHGHVLRHLGITPHITHGLSRLRQERSVRRSGHHTTWAMRRARTMPERAHMGYSTRPPLTTSEFCPEITSTRIFCSLNISGLGSTKHHRGISATAARMPVQDDEQGKGM